MKKVIRLSENDLVNIVKRIINEQDGDITPYNVGGPLYRTKQPSVGKYSFKQITQDKLNDYLKWYQGTTYPEIQEYITKTYGIPQLFNPKTLQTPGKKNWEHNLFKQFLNAVQASLYMAAKLNYNGKLFNADYDLKNLNYDMGDRFVTKDWIAVFEENLPVIGKLPEFKKFVSKVIDARRNTIGVKS